MVTNEFGQPIGDQLTAPLPSGPPTAESLFGRFCSVEPLNIALHLDGLWSEFSSAPDGRDWTYLPDEPFNAIDEFRHWTARAIPSVDPLFFAIVDRATGKAAGFATYLRIVPSSASIEVGYIHFGQSLRRTPAATEAMYLMMRHAFDAGYRRYEWKCDALNAPSRTAAQRLGFTYEGTFRQATTYKGRTRDTAWFSLIDSDWPAVRAELERWLAPSNFDSDGAQLTRLTCGALSEPS